MPERIQRKRTKGWRMPEGAVYVGRPTKWGNPYKVEDRIGSSDPLAAHIVIPGGWSGLSSVTMMTPSQVVDAYFDWIVNDP